MLTSPRVVAIVVTYRPDLDALSRLLDVLKTQVAATVVVDNGSAGGVQTLLHNRLSAHEHMLILDDNLGIAAAQNIGIAWAEGQGAEFVLLSDQDSLPAPDMVATLLSAAQDKMQEGIKLAAVGPRYLDPRQDNPPPFIRVKGLRVERQMCASQNAIVEVDYLIASGCLLPVQTLRAVGAMREELFIDYVDIEWGLRAKGKGFRSFGVCAAKMCHDLGDAPIEFMGRKLPVHSPLRHYYHFRNAVWMYRQSWLPTHWKLADGWRLLLKYGFYTLFAKPRWQHWRLMSLGIWHGVRGRLGRLDGQN